MDSWQQGSSLLDLSGRWDYSLDIEDQGIDGQWFLDGRFPKSGFVSWPGTLATNGIGEQIEYGLDLTKENVRCLRQRHRYVGAAWYERTVDVPKDWQGSRVRLLLERVMFQSSVWLNGCLLGSRDSLSTPHIYDVTDTVLPGETNVLTIRIDNRDVQRIGEHPSAYTDETQTIWNGAIGRLELQRLPDLSIEHVQIYPEPEHRRAVVKGMLVNALDRDVQASLRIHASEETLEGDGVTAVIPPVACGFAISARESLPFETVYPMGENVKLWDEFSPTVYELELSLFLNSADSGRSDTPIARERVTFGMRTFRAVGNRLEINGIPTFLRGTLECCIFPMTGHPPMEIEEWNRIFNIVKEYGLNHVRFHSWCPPEQAFVAADRLGVYLQVEGPVWMDTWNVPVGSHPEHYDYLPAEAMRIVREYGNHASFCLYSNGNELNGDFALLSRMVKDVKAGDSRRVYSLTTNWDRPLDEADDLFCAQTVDGIGVRGQYFSNELIDSTVLDFRTAVAKRDVPVISHEVGQYSIFPDMREIGKYSGALDPVNFKTIRAELERKGLSADAEKFVMSSGMLALQLYRDEIEAALRTPGLGGIQLLDLHDFPGQSTATVGILNAFWESKGLIEPELFRQFCAPTVLLLRMQKRVYICGEPFEADIEIAHFGTEWLEQQTLTWSVQDENGKLLDQGTFAVPSLGQGSGQPVGKLRTDALSLVSKACRLKMTLEVPGEGLLNSWPIWVFPGNSSVVSLPKTVTITESLDEMTEQILERGGEVLLVLSGAKHANATPGKYMPVFWSPVHFATDNPCGVFIDHSHPIFSDFPTRYYAEPHWRDLLDRSWSLNMDPHARGVEPIVQVVPNFFHIRRLTNLFEANVGAGRIIVCGIDIVNDLPGRPVAAQLRNSILRYMESDAFKPKAAMGLKELMAMLAAGESG